MKIKEIKTQKENTFKPFTIQITIETMKELASLCKRFSLTPEEIDKICDKENYMTDFESQEEIWSLLNNKFNEILSESIKKKMTQLE